MPGTGNPPDNVPVPFPQWEQENRMSQRLAAIESDIRTMQRDIGRLEGQYDTVAAGLGEVRQELVGMRTDLKWIKETLLEEVRNTASQAKRAHESSGRAEKAAKDDGNTAKALGVIAILASIIAGLLGLNASGIL